MRWAFLLLPLLLAFLHPLGVVGTPSDTGPPIVSGPLLTPPNPEVYAAMPFVLSPPEGPLFVTPAQSTEKVLAIFVDFQDVAGSQTPEDVGEIIFSQAPGTPSIHNFYGENSYGRTTVVGNTTNQWYRSSRAMNYYGADDTGVDDANVPIYCLVVEAVRAADPDVDFREYDTDSSGEVDHLIVVHAGNGQEGSLISTLIWSHHWAIIDPRSCPGESSASLQVDGVQVREYLMAAETSPLGVFVHEFGHDFDLPDLYDTTGQTAGIGEWGVMGTGSWNGEGSIPAQFTAWSKAQLGWLELTVVADALVPASIPALATAPVAFKLPVKESFRGEEYFIVENRQPTGFDVGLPGSGLLIWHVDETFRDNNNPNRRLLDLEEADDGLGLGSADNPTQSSDPWRNNPLGFTAETVPNSADNTGARTGWKVSGISPSGPVMQANLSIGVAVDVLVLDITRPSFVPLSQNVSLGVTVVNRGLTNVTDGTLVLDIFLDDYNLTARVWTDQRALPFLTVGATLLLPFTFTPTQTGTYLIEAFASVEGDELPENNIRIVHLVAGQELFLEDVKLGNSGWNTSTPAGSTHQWEVVTDGGIYGSAHSPSWSWRFGDFGSAGQVVDGFYHLESPEIDLQNEVPRLLYYQRYQLGTGAAEPVNATRESDIATVAVSFNGGVDWIELARFEGSQTEWARVYVDLARYATGAQSMRIRFNSTAGIMPEEGGWWIDDIVVLKVPMAPMPLLRPLESQKTVVPGSTVSFLFILVNVGDLLANFTLQVEGLPVDWDAFIGRNETSAIPVSAFEERLGVDEQRSLNLIVRSHPLAARGVLHQGVLRALIVDEEGEARFVFALQVPLGFGLDLGGQTFVVVLIIGGVMLALAMVLTRLRRRRTYPPY